MGRLTRVRLEAEGHDAASVDFALRRAAEIFNETAFLQASNGECVIERDVGEPEGAHTAWKGRLIMHPNVAEEATQRQVLDIAKAAGSGFQVTGSGFVQTG